MRVFLSKNTYVCPDRRKKKNNNFKEMKIIRLLSL